MEPAHGERVARLSAKLFSETAHLHGLTKTWGPIVKVAGFLQGAFAPYAGAASVAAEFEAQLKRRIRSLTAAQHRIVVRALQLQGQASPPRSPGPRKVEDELALRIAAILRIADALDQPGSEEVSVAGVEDDGAAVALVLFPSPSAVSNALAGLARADLWNAVARRPIRAIRVLKPAERVPQLIRPEEPSGAVVRRLQQRQLDQFASRVFGVRFREDIEFVHEMRVALRRLRAVLRLFRKALGKQGAAFAAEVRHWAGELSAVRDLDVFLQFLHRYAEGAPDPHRPFLARLVARERANRAQHCRKATEQLESMPLRDFLRRHGTGGTPRGGPALSGDRADRPIALDGPRLLLKRLTAALQYDKPLRSYPPDKLHKLRIRCKRVRYAAEFLSDLYPDGLASLIETLVDMQDLLGDVHDLGLYIERVRGYDAAHRAGCEPASPDAAKTLLDSLTKKQAARLRSAAAVWRRFTKKGNLRELTQRIRQPQESFRQPANPEVQQRSDRAGRDG